MRVDQARNGDKRGAVNAVRNRCRRAGLNDSLDASCRDLNVNARVEDRAV